jgi:hypothetical protein
MATVQTSPRPRKLPSPHTLLKGVALARSGKVIFRLTLLLIAVGVGCRVLRYLLQFPLWGDEAYLCVNFLDRDYLGLTKKLDNCQVAPILFLWGEYTAYRLLGSAEWAMRLLPFLASMGGLFLFWRLARLTLAPSAALFAVGFLAVARWPVTMGAVIKPYSFDLFFALVLLVPAVSWLRWPEQRRWLILLAAVVPVVLMGSYPSVFVAGSVSLALLPTVWRERRSIFVWLGYLAYNALMLSTFLACLLVVGREQLDPETNSVGNAMRAYWADGFPPHQPLELLRWFALINTGRIMAYPVGESNGGSIVTFVLFLVGIWRFWKKGRRTELVLLVTPFALNLLAAFMDRYPYGACCRLSQHLAPSVCLLAGAGLAAVLERLGRRFDWQRRGTYAVTGLFLLCGVVQSGYDLNHPYRDEEGLWSRQVLHELDHLAVDNDRVVVALPRSYPWPVLRWQLQRLGNRVSWGGSADWQQLETNGGRVWLVSVWLEESQPTDQLPADQYRACHWVRVNSVVYALRRRPRSPNLICTVSCWLPEQRAHHEPPPVISCWP